MPEEVQSDLNDTIERLFGLLTRRRWWILATTFGSALATIVVVMPLPNRYTSEATLLVVQQEVPQRYVTPTTTTDISDALQAMTQQVLSRTRLLGIIAEYNLYAREKRIRAPEEVIELMRRYISIQPLEGNNRERKVSAFKISFTAETPHLAQQVTSKLTTLFIEENLKTRMDQATNTTNFLHEQLETATEKLTRQEQRLRDFKMQYLGELPEQQQGNLQILGGLETQLQNTMAALNRAQQQRVYLESLLSGYRRLAVRDAPQVGIPGVGRTDNPVDAVQTDLARLQSQRTALLSLYTSKHPDVVRIEQDIAKAKSLLENQRASRVTATDVPTQIPAAVSVGGEDATSVAQLKSQLEANRLEIENLSKDETQLKAAVAQYQTRLNLTPVREQQLAGILRDYDLLKQNHADLLSKEQQSQLAASLEKQQEGEQFRLVDPPSLPTLPSSPKRLKISLGGAVVGVFLGLVLAFLADVRDHSFRTEKELSQHFPLPIVLGLPVLLTTAEERLRKRKRILEWLAGCAVTFAVFVAEFYIYRHR